MAQWEDAGSNFQSSYDPNLRSFLNLIGGGEGAQYNTIVGGKKVFEDYSQHPAYVGVRTADGPSTAAGRYQITKSTYNDVAPKLGIKDFTPESQDKIAVELIRRNGAMDDVLRGDYQSAIKKLGGTWASLPSSPYNQPKMSQQRINAMVAQNTTGGWEDAPSAPKASSGGWEDAPEVSPKAVPQATTQAQPQAPIVATDPKPLTDSGMEADPTWIGNAKMLYKQTEGADFKGSDADAAKWLKNYVAQTQWNLASAGGTVYDALNKLDDSGKQALLNSLKAYSDAPTSLESVGRAAKGIILDPTTYLGMGWGKALQLMGKQAANKGVELAIQQGLEKSLAKRLANSAVTKNAAVAGASGAANNLAQQGVQVAANGQEGIDAGDLAKSTIANAAGGATVGKVLNKLSGNEAVEKFVRGTGSAENARVKAEVAKDFADVANNPNLRVLDDQGLPTVAAAMRNQKAKGYVEKVKNALERVDPAVLKKIDVENALAEQRVITPEQLKLIRTSPNGNVLADAIDKYQQAMTHTAPTPASGSLGAKLLRGGIEYGIGSGGALASGNPLLSVFAPKLLKGFAERLTGKQSVPEVIENLSSGKNLKAADKVLEVLKASQAFKGTARLTNQARNMEANAAAKAAQDATAQQAQKAQTLADNATARQNMGLRGSPLSGPYATTLQYSGATNEQAVPVLRQLVKDNKGSEIGKAAQQLLKSDPRVENSPAFYAVQGILKDVVGGGALSQATTKASGSVGKVGGNFGSAASKIVTGLDDATVANLVGRTEDMSGDAIISARKYLVGKIANTLKDQKNGNALDQEALDLLKAIGM